MCGILSSEINDDQRIHSMLKYLDHIAARLRGAPRVCLFAGAAGAACLLSFLAGRLSSSTETQAVVTEAVEMEEERQTDPHTVPLATPSYLPKPYATESQADYQDAPIAKPDVLVLAYLYGEEGGSMESLSPSGSMAGQLYQELASMDSQWLSGIYDLYNYTPLQAANILGLTEEAVSSEAGFLQEFTNMNVQFANGAGASIDGQSNARTIVSMCNVLHYYGLLSTMEEMEAYAKELWNASHHYSVELGQVYFCDGDCVEAEGLAEEAEAAEEAAPDPENVPATEETASVPEEAAPAGESESNGQAASPSENSDLGHLAATPSAAILSCPGHIDLTIHITIRNTEEAGGLFDQDILPAGAMDSQSSLWPGWNQETLSYVDTLLSQDWYEMYGINAADLLAICPLTGDEIEFFMKLVPMDASQVRRDMVRYALASVGKIPYYWGGKPSRPGYTGNHFGSVVQPDREGRFLKGLDCSGWINWVYWSVTGQSLGAQSTATLVSSGQAISKDELLPGDICIRLGEEPHVVMYLGWSPDGRMVCIQETSGSTDNVEVALVAPDWASYRRLTD